MGATDNTQRLGPSRVERRAAHRLWEVEVLAMFLFHLFGVCVCVGNPNYNGHSYSFQNTDMSIFENAGGAMGLQKAGTNEDLAAFL